MENAVLYSHHNYVHTVNTEEILNKYLHLVKLKKNAYILDIGAGDGMVTFEILLPKVPNNFEEIVLSDVSQDMIDFAKGKYGGKKTDFIKLDIAADKVSQDLMNRFDHIFSFTCLHWVKEERQVLALRNIFDMLKPGGSTFITIIAKSTIFNFFENMAQYPKWATYMENVQKCVSPYFGASDPSRKLREFLEAAGLDVGLCCLEKRYYVFSSWEDFLNFVLSVNPFDSKIPENERENYVADLTVEMKTNKMVIVQDCNGTKKIKMPYETLIACAYKPL